MDELKEQDIVTEITLKALLDTDIQELGLYIGQRAVLKSALGTLMKDSQTVIDLSAPAAPDTQSEVPTTRSLAKNQHISELLTAMENDLLPGVLSTFSK